MRILPIIPVTVVHDTSGFRATVLNLPSWNWFEQMARYSSAWAVVRIPRRSEDRIGYMVGDRYKRASPSSGARRRLIGDVEENKHLGMCIPSPGTIDHGSGSSELGLVEAPGVEPGSEDLQRNGSTCVADRFSFAATHAHRLA